MSNPTEIDRQAAAAAEYLALAELLDTLPESGWDTQSLCEAWRVREVVGPEALVSVPVIRSFT